MQFLVLGYDGTDPEALSRRLAVREEHLKLFREGLASGKFRFGTAILNDDGQMAGSAILAEFPSREALEEWLRREPYVTGHVWQTITVHRAQMPACLLER
ncbi:MAG TPA: YciI family protein [Synergistaceae bacterium]|nr:YciI family protein [Synergistaceae bacterium]